MRPICDYLGMPRPPTPHDTTHDASHVVGDAPTTRPMCVAFRDDVAHVSRTCPTCLARDAYDARRALARDARRDAYATRYDHAPTLRAIRERYARGANEATPNAFAPRPPRPHKDTRLDVGPNAWEDRAPHLRTHLRPDRTCHHPLVRCSHK